MILRIKIPKDKNDIKDKNPKVNNNDIKNKNT